MCNPPHGHRKSNVYIEEKCKECSRVNWCYETGYWLDQVHVETINLEFYERKELYF